MSIRTNAGFLDSVPIGAGMEWFTNTPPENWMLQNGAAISRTEYAELFAIIGITYGAGNGTTTFNLPNKMGRTGVGKASNGTFATLGAKVGSETHTIGSNNLPRYVNGIATNINSNADLTLPSGGDVVTVVQPNFGGENNPQPISNVQPSLVQNYIIKVK